MNPALEDSIAHWQRMAKGDTSQNDKPNANQCALCRLFNSGSHQPTDCEGCPVYVRTGKKYCADTPFEAVEDIYCGLEEKGLTYHEILKSTEFQVAAEKELEFLISLRDNDKGNTPQ